MDLCSRSGGPDQGYGCPFMPHGFVQPVRGGQITQSAEGSRFVERLLTVVETCRRQQRNVLCWMVEAVEASFAGKTAPSLLSGV
jgi:hypothetical protein